jgi:hypothetical protein
MAKAKRSAECKINESKRPVGDVHSPDNEEVFGDVHWRAVSSCIRVTEFKGLDWRALVRDAIRRQLLIVQIIARASSSSVATVAAF